MYRRLRERERERENKEQLRKIFRWRYLFRWELIYFAHAHSILGNTNIKGADRELLYIR